MRLILTAICLSFFVLSPAVHAVENGRTRFAVVSPPECINHKGEAVRFITQENALTPAAAGMANRNKAGQPVVFRFGYDLSPPELQIFIDFHECAHHQTGDIDLPHPPHNSPERMMNESIADCIAAMRIRDDYEQGRRMMTIITEELKKAMETAGFAAVTISSRLSNIKNCLNRDETAATFLDGVLQHRGLRHPAS